MKKGIKALITIALAFTMLFGMSMTVCAANVTAEDLAVGTMLEVIAANPQLNISHSNEDESTLYAYANFVEKEIWILKDDSTPPDGRDIYDFSDQEGSNDSGSRGYTATLFNIDPDSTPFTGTYTIVRNDYWVAPADPDHDNGESEPVAGESEPVAETASQVVEPVSPLNEMAKTLLKNAKSGDTVVINSGEWNSFPDWFMREIAEKTKENVNFEFRYVWNRAEYDVEIKAGEAVDTGIDWYGPAKMAELYGATVTDLDTGANASDTSNASNGIESAQGGAATYAAVGGSNSRKYTG